MTKQSVEIDGRMGEGGGQILRTSLTLALLYGLPVSITRIRNKRPKPGLLRQHLTCVKAAQAISGGQATGAELRSESLTFKPGAVRGGDYHFDVGNAGSTTLVFQTVLLPLLQADAPSTVRFTGGTHNPWAPPLTFLEEAFLPLMRQMGAQVTIKTGRWGYHPAGGGEWVAHISPSTLKPLELVTRPALSGSTVTAYASNIRRGVADRELARYQELDPASGSQFQREFPEALCAGNLLSHALDFGGVRAHFSELGEHRIKAETIAERLAKRVSGYLAAPAVLCEHLADQVMLPMLVAGGGRFSTGKLSLHADTNRQLIEQVTGQRIMATGTPEGIELALAVNPQP
ncbi:RNA 3'-terminal phosphate cyclase [Marinobacter zhejiangensis]|uniref:RNA 3'-terminal phosphate cyclase n=1 Tax=Marinobacter zhejiangensis TaxID=488535 RepID=A0A1I4NUV2_9GAMM|nr:RNA 3'-terminal phosphate cyclase [Marinobacter zhejiangensis]SFM19100.1 RNA 3'-terminal phosphate cyclase (ATP) [Marinobacter zhejiangensis]